MGSSAKLVVSLGAPAVLSGFQGGSAAPGKDSSWGAAGPEACGLTRSTSTGETSRREPGVRNTIGVPDDLASSPCARDLGELAALAGIAGGAADSKDSGMADASD